MMKMRSAIFTIVIGLTLAAPLHAHRAEGLLQASLAEFLPSQVGVEVALIPGIDVAPKVIALLDTNGDGVFSDAESAAWSARFMAGQSVAVDGRWLLLKLRNVRASPLLDMSGGHAESSSTSRPIPARLRAASTPSSAPTVANPSRAITKPTASYRRLRACASAATVAPNARWNSLSSPNSPTSQPPATQAARSANIILQNRSTAAIPWLMGLSVTGAIVAVVCKRRQWFASFEL